MNINQTTGPTDDDDWTWGRAFVDQNSTWQAFFSKHGVEWNVSRLVAPANFSIVGGKMRTGGSGEQALARSLTGSDRVRHCMAESKRIAIQSIHDCLAIVHAGCIHSLATAAHQRGAKSGFLTTSKLPCSLMRIQTLCKRPMKSDTSALQQWILQPSICAAVYPASAIAAQSGC